MDDSTPSSGIGDLPGGQVIAIDALIRQRAERERIDAAIVKLRAKGGLAEAALRQIEQAFNERLYLQGLTPVQWHTQALAITQTLLGDGFASREKALSQVLFVCSRFHFAEPVPAQRLTRYAQGEQIPTRLLSEAPSPAGHTMHDIPGYLGNRLGRTVLEMLGAAGCGIEVFIGPKGDMADYYRTCEPALTLKGEIQSPTSSEFYLFSDAEGRPTLVITGISNRSRFLHQLWQLKYAGVDLRRVHVRGTFAEALAPQVTALQRELDKLPVKPRIAILGQRWWPMEILGQLAGIVGPEGMAYQTLQPSAYQIGPFVFDYLIAEVAGAPAWRSQVGIVAFRMPNGSLAGEAVDALLQAGMTHLLLAGAGGSLDPDIAVGSYRLFDRASYDGVTYTLPVSSQFVPALPDDFPLVGQGTNVTVDSPLEESRAWLAECRAQGHGVVDVESAAVFRVLLNHPRAQALRVTPGLFISDVVGGEASLVEKIGIDEAYAHLQTLLVSWFCSVGVAGVYDASGTPHRFATVTARPNPHLIRVAQSTPDLNRHRLMGVRMRSEDFQVVASQRRKVGYPDLKAMRGHKSILYVIPGAQDDGAFATWLRSADAESLFLCFPPDAPQPAIDAARAAGFETIAIVEPHQPGYPQTDFLAARDSGWGTYATVVANSVQAVAVFGDPGPHAGLLVKADNERLPILIEESWADLPLLEDLADVRPFTAQTYQRVLQQALKLDRLAGWLSRARPDIRVLRLGELRDHAAGRKIIGMSGSSKVSQFDAGATERALVALLHGLDPDRVMFITGGTDYGVERILHRLIKTRFPAFGCVGLITGESRGDELGTPVVAIAGHDWFGRSVPFLNAIDLLVTVAGGSVVGQELLLAYKAGIPIVPLAGSGMSTDEFLAEHPALPRCATGDDMCKAITQCLDALSDRAAAAEAQHDERPNLATIQTA